MESNWRYNVFEFGMVGWTNPLPLGLLARIRTGPWAGYYLSDQKLADTNQLYVYLGPGLILFPFGTPTRPIPDGNFPYGFDVDPD